MTPACTSLRIISTHSAETTIREPAMTPPELITSPTPSVAGAAGGGRGSDIFSVEIMVSISITCAATMTLPPTSMAERASR